MITRGGINLGISENAWDGAFRNAKDKGRAEKILEALSEMSVFSAKDLLDTCKKLIELSIAGVK